MKYLDYMDEIVKAGIFINKNTSEIQIHSPMGGNAQTVKIAPLSIECDTMRHKSNAEYEAIRWAIDFDKWQYSWHNEVKPENYEYFLDIIQKKIIEKSQDLVRLNAIATFLGNEIERLKSESPESLVKISKEIDDNMPF